MTPEQIAADMVVVEPSLTGERKVWIRCSDALRTHLPLEVRGDHIELACEAVRASIAQAIRHYASHVRNP
jgi:hypothetical protein